MAEQFSLPQKRVLEELDGESYSWLTCWAAPGSPAQAYLGRPSLPFILGSTWAHLRRGRDWARLGSTEVLC